jgi:hypothetical protein
MAGAVAEAGAAQKATEILTFVVGFDHGIAKLRARDAPMRSGVCRGKNLSSKVIAISRFHLGGIEPRRKILRLK